MHLDYLFDYGDNGVFQSKEGEPRNKRKRNSRIQDAASLEQAPPPAHPEEENGSNPGCPLISGLGK
jgi:hypothetical protein